MIGKLLELGGPKGIDRPELLEVAADPALQQLARLALGHFHGVVDAGQPDTLLHELSIWSRCGSIGFFAPPSAKTTIAAGAVEELRVCRPAVAMNHGFDVGQALRSAGRQQQAAGVVFVLGIAVAGRPGDEDDLLSPRIAFAQLEQPAAIP